MKVTVCFGNVRVIVPCGNGNLLVRDLIEKALTRYKKATGKPSTCWVTVHNLKSSSDGGILDQDDQLLDVADDREQIIAIYEEQGGPLLPHNGGDGTSASSVGTESPDIFQGDDITTLNQENVKFSYNGVYQRADVEITGNEVTPTNSSLHVRRGSEPALNSLSPIPAKPNSNKRWSAAAILDDDSTPLSSPLKDDEHSDEEFSHICQNSSGQDKFTFSRFEHDTTRVSILGNHPAMFKWSEAQEKQEDRHLQDRDRDSRGEPAGGSTSSHEDDCVANKENSNGQLVIMKNEGGPLGIHVVPDCDDNGRDMGLIIQGIEPGGRIDTDGRLQVMDRIIEINGQSLININFQKAQDIFKEALKTKEIRLWTIKKSAPPLPKKPPPPVGPKPKLSLDQLLNKTDNHQEVENSFTKPVVDYDKNLDNNNKNQPWPTESSNGKCPPVPVRIPASFPVIKERNIITAPTNTRKLGKKIHIQLTKGSDGLGFSITTRDNPAGGNCPIYIKSILSKGAAIQDGRLKSGDRLLEVNGIEMTGKMQQEAVTILRNTKLGGVVDLVVSRQEALSPTLPRQLVSLNSQPPFLPASASVEKTIEESSINVKQKEFLTFDIPLNDTGSAGLGVSVKGKTSTGPSGPIDLGIFIKSVIHGGAASKDGRLKTNDQLISINGISLLLKSNNDAMETLRKAMHLEGPNPGFMTLTVARKIFNESVQISDESSNSSHISNHKSQNSFSGSCELLSFGKENTNICLHSNEITEETELSSSYLLKEKTADSNLNENVSDALDSNKFSFDVDSFRNPVIDRITGKCVRNESYFRATNDSWSATGFSLFNDNSQPLTTPLKASRPIGGSLGSPTINMPSEEIVMIENDEQKSFSPMHPRGMNFSISSNKSSSSVPTSISNIRAVEGEESNSAWLKDLDNNQLDLSLSDVDSTLIFQREGFGRQSMSEKRNAQLDAKNTDTYRRNKKQKELQHQSSKQTPEAQNQPPPLPPHPSVPRSVHLRSNSADSVLSIDHSNQSNMPEFIPKDMVGPTLGMKKSSSLESLQIMVQEAALENGESQGQLSTAVKVVRGRGCNESFRAAVDRSYDAPATSADTMETLDEESDTSSVSKTASISVAPGGPDPPVDANQCRKKKNKKSGGIFKGLGSVFKFGKNRKVSTEQPVSEVVDKQWRDELAKTLQARKEAQEEQDRIQEQYKKLKEKQLQQEQQKSIENNHEGGNKNNNNNNINTTNNNNSTSRQDRIHQLRYEYQRKHQERQGQYPHEEKEEWYEQQMREEEKKGNFDRPRNYENSWVLERPGSRTGFVDQAYNHYQNIEEIHLHLRHHPQVSSLRQGRNHPRPISNFYEYNAVHWPESQTNTHSLPRRPKKFNNAHTNTGVNYCDYDQLIKPQNGIRTMHSRELSKV